MLAVFRWSAIAAGLALLLAGAASAQRIPCPDVIHAMNRLRSAGSTRGEDAAYLARHLNTSSEWVEKCASIYGRRMKVEPLDRDERVRREQKWESEEPTELGREEAETKGDKYVRATQERDRRRQREMGYFKQEWQPAEHDPWEPDLGHEWTPDLVDEQREPRVRIPGQVTD